MLRTALSLVGSHAAPALPAVQHLLGVAQHCCFATSTPPYLRDSTAAAKAKKGAPKATTKATTKEAKSAAAKPKPEKQVRPLSAYTLFIKDKAAGAVKAPGSTAGDMMKKLAQEWKSLSDAQKAPWVTKANVMKEEVLQARAALPKKPPGAYGVYFKEQYSLLAGRGLKVTEAAKEIASLWKALPESEKQERKTAAKLALEKWKAAN